MQSFVNAYNSSNVKTPALGDERWLYTPFAKLNKNQYKTKWAALKSLNLEFKPLALSDASTKNKFNCLLKSSRFSDRVSRELANANPDNIFCLKVSQNSVVHQFISLNEIFNYIGDGNLETRFLFVEIGENSKLTIFDDKYDSLHSHHCWTAVDLAGGANVTWISMSPQISSTTMLDCLHVELGRDARFSCFDLLNGGFYTRIERDVFLKEAGADAILVGLSLLTGTEITDVQTNVEHLVGMTKSDQKYKGVLADRSKSVYGGRVKIHKGADGSNSNQLSQNLVLDKGVEVDTKPQLEVDADDVKAAHGASIGKFDPEQLFYLQSRCLSEVEALTLLSYGFCEELVSHVGDSSLHDLLEKRMLQKLQSVGGSKFATSGL